ncbi:MAG: LON peptidase substrate-binding domain-containing protein [Thermoanaerobaculia bacterium]|nr:LON peptidase substrate-binding domain-containing protein [Thermoanaerobaculia bacterium]
MSELVLPLFPLPDLVHFPGTPLPLHIFQPRYRQLVAELLARPEQERRIGMILVARDADSGVSELLEPGCAGRLVAHQPLADGRSNIVLLGEFRFAVERELSGRPWRQAVVRPLSEQVPLLEAERADELGREITALAAAVARLSEGRFPLDSAELGGAGRPGGLMELVNRLAARLDLPALRKQTLLADEPLARAGEIAGILRSRLRLLDSLDPFRHLAARSEAN